MNVRSYHSRREQLSCGLVSSWRHCILPWVLSCMVSGSQAQIYMCQDAEGHKTYSQDPCGAQAKIIQQQDIDGSITIATDATPERKAADLCHMAMQTLNIARRRKPRMNVDAMRCKKESMAICVIV